MWQPRQQLNKMTLLKFSQTLEERIQEEIEDAYPANWDEDYISRRILVALTSMRFSKVEVLTTFNNIFITSFKLKGNLEKHFGDIAFVIQIEYKDGDSIRGAAFLEAKRRYANSDEYTKLDFTQLKRIYQNAPSARLLLYNYQYMSNLAPTGLDNSKNKASGLLPKIPGTYTSVLPANTAIHLNKKGDSLHKLSIPLSYQLSFRYLFGKDLEFSDDVINKTLGFVSSEQLPKHVVMINIKPSKKGDKETNFVFQPEINRELYAEITDISRFDNDRF
ncbi:MAG: hypothetical protein DI539_14615 [Flavobacterium psychrophilum]|nr:MAG: hypothetical protein DI539_14615 [Flavobacterium psychrophilum]